MKTNEITVQNLIDSKVLKVAKIKVSREEKIKTSLEKLESKEILNNWDRLSITTKKTELETFSLSKIAKTFIEVGKDVLTDSQKSILTFDSIKNFVNSSDKYKDKTMFSLNDIKLICNSIIKAEDKGTKLALKVAKQGGTIVQ